PNPVSLRRIDRHSLWANAAALRAAGIGKDTPDPHGGRIVRDATGAATGVLVDEAMGVGGGKIPPAHAAHIRRRREGAHAGALGAGLTGVHEMGIDDDVIAVYRQLAAEGALKVRVYAMLSGPSHLGELATRRPDRDPDGAALFVLGGV